MPTPTHTPALPTCAAPDLSLGLLTSKAHDVRGPMTAVRGLAQGLARALPTLAPEPAEMLAQWQTEAVRTVGLLDGLLDLLRVAHSHFRDQTSMAIGGGGDW